MSNRDDKDGPPPPDDRTLLDPLSTDELEALRQARQRLQAQRKAQHGGEAKPRQMVVGPEDDDAIGHAPTRAMPSLPSFDGKVSLDQIHTPQSRVSGRSEDPASRPQPSAAPSEPMSVYSGTVGPLSGSGEEPTLTPSGPTSPPSGPLPSPRARPSPASAPPAGRPGPGGPQAGATGFGENTLMWMAPPKVGQAAPGAAATADVGAPPPKGSTVQKLKNLAVFGVLALLVAAIAAATIFGGDSGVIELHTDPPNAVVKIDGKEQAARTPVKLTMNEGRHLVELSLEGFTTKQIELNVDPERPQRTDVVLEPKSQAGLVTVSVGVQPVSAKIVVDGVVHEGKRSIKVANLDPGQPHTLVVEAAGYKRIEKTIRAGDLKASYNFALQSDPSARPE